MIQSLKRSGAFKRPRFDLLVSSETAGQQEIKCLPDLVRFNALHNPDHTFCVQAQLTSHDQTLDFRYISFFELDQAVERCCNWILANVKDAHPAKFAEDGSVRKSQPIALFMESDVGLFIYIAALLTLNIPCLLLSIRLSAAAIRQLLKQTEASTIIVSSRTLVNAQDALSGSSEGVASLVNAVSFDHFLGPSDFPPSRQFYPSGFVSEDDRNVIILHSSGTTGLPKAIPLAHRNLLGYAACHLFPDDEDESLRGINVSTLPLFHGFGCLGPCLSLSVGKTCCLPPSSTIVNGTLTITLVRELHATSLMTVPTIMEEILSSSNFDHAASVLSTLDFVAVGGGGMKAATGQQFHSRCVKLLNHFGATELGALAPIFRPGSDYDYRYLKVRSDMGLKIVSLDPAVHSMDACKIVGHPFGWDSAFELQDLLERNPKHWESQVRILGRNDDFIVLATGEKVVPQLLEQALQQDPRVRFAVAFGTGQAQIGVLVEPQYNFASAEVFVDEIWPIIQRTNSLLDGHARLPTKAAVLVKPADKAIPLSDKGVPQRKEVYTVFAAEIDSVYQVLEEGRSDGLASNIDFDRIEDSIRMLVEDCIPSYSKTLDWSNDEDFINMGMDSLQATRLRRSLSTSLRRQGHILVRSGDLPLDFVYRHASVSRLARALSGPEAAPVSQQMMRDLLSKYSFSQANSTVSSRGATILVTGSTGNLGAHLLDSLSRNHNVSRVICLIRPNTPAPQDSTMDALKRRQQGSLDQRGIVLPKEAWSKLAFLPWKPQEQHLGLRREQYEILLGEVTDIFHGAWPMDFKRTVLSFEPQIRALRNLLKLGEAIHQNRPDLRPKVIFTSSIAVAGCLGSEHEVSKVVSEKLYSAESALPMGYAEGKWVCERVMESAHENRLGSMQPMVLRIGQLAGSEATGYWSSQEHIAALVKASRGLGRMPDLQGTFSWLPVNIAADVISDLLLRPAPARNLVYNLENPVRQPWSGLCTLIERKLGILSRRLPYKEWLQQVIARELHPEGLHEFFRDHFLRMSNGGIILDTKLCRSVSPTLRVTGGVGLMEISLYLESWKQQGYL